MDYHNLKRYSKFELSGNSQHDVNDLSDRTQSKDKSQILWSVKLVKQLYFQVDLSRMGAG